MQVQHLNEPIAWWMVGLGFMILLGVVGALLRYAYNGLIKRLESLERVLKLISDFIAKQDEKNRVYSEVKERFDSVEDKVLELEKAHKVCQYYPLNNRRT